MDFLALLAIAGLVVVVVPIVGLVIVSSRLRRLEFEVKREGESRESNNELIASLAHRVAILERPGLNKAGANRSAAQDVTVPTRKDVPPPLVTTPVLPPPLALTVVEPEAAPAARAPLPKPQPAVPPFAVPTFAGVRLPQPSPLPSVSAAPPPKSMGAQEWEALVGGNWLNKVGVLVFVIGVALLLGYEFTRLGPFGRVAIGLGVSLTMLIGGVVLERRKGYAIFARGLIGGGWAALYFTTYAMYGVNAAKVIENSYLASALLLAVAAGMILHSLRYKSETASGLAYFIAFATLGLSASTPFSVLALLPLAGSLLILAHRFQWYKMAVFGLLATYATCASRPDTGAPLASTQALFGAYWLLFEAFDLLSLKRRDAEWPIESLILPLNALGFLGLSLVKWHRTAPEHVHAFLAAGAALYLVSALLHSRLRPPAGFLAASDTFVRMAGGGYEGPITIASALAAAAVIVGATGEWINLGLLVEGELLFLAGVRFGESYLRQLAGAAFIGSVVKILVLDKSADQTVTLLRRKWVVWSPVAALEAAVFYGNRMLGVVEGVVYSSVAAGLITLALGYETPLQYVGVGWMTFALLLFEFGFIRRKPEFLYQSYVVGALGTGAATLFDIFIGDATWHLPWLPLAIGMGIHYAITMHAERGDAQRLSESERNVLPWVTSTSAATFLAAIVWKLARSLLGCRLAAVGNVVLRAGPEKIARAFPAAVSFRVGDWVRGSGVGARDRSAQRLPARGADFLGDRSAVVLRPRRPGVWLDVGSNRGTRTRMVPRPLRRGGYATGIDADLAETAGPGSRLGMGGHRADLTPGGIGVPAAAHSLVGPHSGRVRVRTFVSGKFHGLGRHAAYLAPYANCAPGSVVAVLHLDLLSAETGCRMGTQSGPAVPVHARYSHCCARTF
jgi:hypothetical protein